MPNTNTILIGDNDDDFLRITSTALTKEEFGLLNTDVGSEGRAYLKNAPPDFYMGGDLYENLFDWPFLNEIFSGNRAKIYPDHMMPELGTSDKTRRLAFNRTLNKKNGNYG